MSLTENDFVKKLIETGEEHITKAATELLSNERMMGNIQKAVGAALEAKGLLERNIQTVLSTMNIPTADDVRKLEGKLEGRIEELERVFEALSNKIGALQKPGPTIPPAGGSAP